MTEGGGEEGAKYTWGVGHAPEGPRLLVPQYPSEGDRAPGQETGGAWKTSVLGPGSLA